MLNDASHQPNISGCLEAVRDAALTHSLQLSEAVDAVTRKLNCHHSGQTPEVPFEALATESLTALAGHTVLVQVLPATKSTSESISDFIAAGTDGEAFAWDIIRFESQYHTKLLWKEANLAARNQAGRTAEDLFGWAWLGLRQAMRQYDPTLGFKFSTYAVPRIKGSIRDGIRSENPVPKRLLTLQRKVATATEELALTLGRAPTLEEISLAVDFPVSSLSDLLPRLRPAASVDEILTSAEEEGGLISQDLYSEYDPHEAAEDASRREAITQALRSIDPKYAESIDMVFCRGLSVAETRRQTGVSDREIRRRIERGIAALGPLLSDWASSR